MTAGPRMIASFSVLHPSQWWIDFKVCEGQLLGDICWMKMPPRWESLVWRTSGVHKEESITYYFQLFVCVAAMYLGVQMKFKWFKRFCCVRTNLMFIIGIYFCRNWWWINSGECLLSVQWERPILDLDLKFIFEYLHHLCFLRLVWGLN